MTVQGRAPVRALGGSAALVALLALALGGWGAREAQAANDAPAVAASDAAGTVAARRAAPHGLAVTAPRRTEGSARVRIRVARAGAVVRMRLNGRRLPVDTVPAEGRTRVVRLTADEGLRHGRNALRVQARNRPGGGLAVATRTIAIRRTAPIPGAGRDGRGKLRRVVVLDGRATRAATLPPNLRYRWEFARTPRGSRARLRRADTRRPRFTPDRPGRYRVRLTVVERRGAAVPRGRRAAGAAARGTDARTGPLGAIAQTTVLGSASDVTSVAVSPPNAGLGVAVDTLDPRGGVAVGDQFYPAAGDDVLQYLVLDRETLAPRTNMTYANDPMAIDFLAAAIEAQPSDAIVIVTTPRLGAVAPIPDAGSLAEFNQAIAKLGAAPIPASVAQSTTACAGLRSGVCGGFSVIGTPGFGSGEGDVNPGLGALGGHGEGGQLTGWLQLDQTETLHTFVPGDHVSFDTTAAGTTRAQAAIEVDGQTYTSAVLPDPKAGAYVLVLDAGTLALRDQGTYSLRYDSADAIVGQLEGMTALLRKYADDPSALVFTQSIGPLARWDAYEGRGDLPFWWNQMANAEQALGSHRTLVNALTGDSDTYARVGPSATGAKGGYPAPWTSVASQAATRSAGQLAGTFARNASSQLYPANAGPSDEPADDLTALAYQPATPWPARDTPARVAALRCVATYLDLVYPVEENYTNENLATAWGNKQDDLDEITPAGLQRRGCDTSAFAQADLDAVTAQLDQEFGDVPIVWQFVRNLQTPFLWASASDLLDLQGIARDVQSAVSPPAETVRYDSGAIAEDVFLLLGAIPGVGAVGEGAELVGAALGLANDTLLASDGTPVQAPAQIDVTALGSQLETNYVNAAQHFEQIGDMLVGDPGKLAAAAAAATGRWAWDDTSTQRATNMLGLSARRFAYTTMFPATFGGLLRGTRGDSSLDIPADGSQYQCFQARKRFSPFGRINPYGNVTVATQAGPVWENWVWSKPAAPNDGNQADGDALYADFSPSLPGAALLQEMFVTNTPEAAQPPLQQLEFTLAIRSQLEVLTVRHATYVDFDDRPLPNQCEGADSGWPGDL